jgi:hypothetical protein
MFSKFWAKLKKYHNIGPRFRLFLAAYIIWYGTWTTAAKNIILNFVSNVGATPYWAINNGYLVGNLVYKGSANDAYSQGTSLPQSSVLNVVVNAFNRGLLPRDPNGIYLVLSSRQVADLPCFFHQRKL